MPLNATKPHQHRKGMDHHNVHASHDADKEASATISQQSAAGSKGFARPKLVNHHTGNDAAERQDGNRHAIAL